MGYDWHSQVALLGVCEFSEFCACKGVLPCKSDFVKSAPKFNNSCSNGVLNDRDPAVRSEINCAHTQSLNGFQTQNSTKASLRLGMNDSDMIRYVWFTVHAQCDAEIFQHLSKAPAHHAFIFHIIGSNSTNPQVVLPQGQLRCTAFQIRSPRQGARRLKQRAEDSYPSKLYYICYLESQILDVWAVLGVLCLFQSNEEKLYIQDSWMK